MAKRDEVLPEPLESIQPKSEKKSLVDLAKAHGQYAAVHMGGTEDPPFSSAHLAAAVLNGWTALKYYKGEEPMLSDADYKAAIEAAKDGKSHAPAMLYDLSQRFEKKEA